MPELIDSHAHLDEVADISGIIRLALQAGVSGIITVSLLLSSLAWFILLSDCTPGPWAA
jgi:hypothetical protein